MSNYSQTTFFTPKDSLPPSNPAKTIFGAAYDVEFGNISSAISSKYDSTTISSAPIAFNLGTAALPGITFVGLTGTGWSSDAGGDLIGSTAGVTCVTFDGTTGAATLTDPLTAPSLKVTGATIPANGIYLSAANTLAFSSNSILRASVNSAGTWSIPAPSAGNTLFLTGGASGQALQISTGATQSGVAISSPSGNSNGILMETGGLLRWFVSRNQTVESGANAGSDFTINAYDDSGAFLGTPISILRTIGRVSIAAPYSGAGASLIVAGSSTGNAINSTANGAGTSSYVATLVGSNCLGLNVVSPAATASSVFNLTQSGQSTWALNNTATTNLLNLNLGANTLLGITPAGNFTINAPTSGTALTVSGFAGANLASLGSLVIATAGNVTIAAPSSGNTLSLTSITSGTAIALTMAASASGSILSANNTAGSFLFDALASGAFEMGTVGNTAFSFYQNNGTLLQLTAGTVNVPNGTGSLSPVYAGVPQNSQAAPYTLVLADANKHIRITAAASGVTIPANSSVAFPIGTVITICNRVGSTNTISITTDLMEWTANNSSGTRTLAVNGMATLLKTDATVWLISGSGIS